MEREFHIGDVLSVTTGRLLSRDGMGGIYNILNFMTQDNLFTHQLPRAMDECKPVILARYPELADETGDEVCPENIGEYLVRKELQFGAKFMLEPLEAGQHQVVHPVSELVDMSAARHSTVN